MNHYAFSGSHLRITTKQQETLRSLLLSRVGMPNLNDTPKEVWLHHGDCVISDEHAHKIAKLLGYKIAIHPPVDDKLRAFCQDADLMYAPEPYIKRNHRMVDVCCELLATPNGRSDRLHSGTWATIRYSQTKRLPTTIIFPDGTFACIP